MYTGLDILSIFHPKVLCQIWHNVSMEQSWEIQHSHHMQSDTISFKVHRLHNAWQKAESENQKRTHQMKCVLKNAGLYLELHIELGLFVPQPPLAPPPSGRLCGRRCGCCKSVVTDNKLKHWQTKNIWFESVEAFETIWQFHVGFDGETRNTAKRKR